MLRSRRISALELADEHIREIQRLNPSLNALTDFDAERVRHQARNADSSPHEPGPLFGLPITIKSSIATAGYRCETGSLIHRGHVPRTDAEIVARARRAGAVLLGTTNCAEFLMSYETDNLLHGRTSNPYHLDYSAGGSSGGEGAAIAAGLSSCGFGSDGGGSVRQPAHATGICSLKPTTGRIPGRGHLPPCVGPFSILGAIGPMARTIADVALLFRILSGHDPLDPQSSPVALRRPSLAQIKQVGIGYFEDDGITPVTPETRQAIRDAVRVLEKKKFKIRPCRPQALELARKLWWTLFVRCGAMLFAPTIRGHEQQLSPVFREFLAMSSALPPMSGPQVLEAWAECDVIRAKLLEEMADCPILLCPVSAIPAFRHGERNWTIDGRQVGYFDAMRYTQWFNLLASPAAVVPVGKSPEGLPIGIQIAGRPFEDELVLSIAAAVEHEFGYTPPPIALHLPA